jgi:hypothetical protein
MAKFVYVYTGGQMAQTPEAVQQAMQAWGAWFGKLGDAVAEIGNPLGAAVTVSATSVAHGAASKATGYSVVTADSLDAAAALADGCPVLDGGGAVHVYEAIPM